MKKIAKFICDHFFDVVLTVVLLVLVACFFLPLFIAIGRDMWQFALS